MRMSDLTTKEEEAILAMRAQQDKASAAAYHQALVDVSGVLTWFSATPGLTMRQLAMMVLAAFEKAGEEHPESAIKKTTDFYRKDYEERWPGDV